jgi:Trypsin-like peptidase domain
VITARHLIEHVGKKYEWPVVFKHDGVFKCRILFSAWNFDVALLEATERLEPASFDEPAEYPRLFSEMPSWGMTVGYLGSLRTLERGGIENHGTYFSAAHISTFLPGGDDKSRYYLLTGGVVQRGFSGGPVFTPSSELLGLVIQSLRFLGDPQDLRSAVYTLPVITPLAPFIGEISKYVSSSSLRAKHPARTSEAP